MPLIYQEPLDDGSGFQIVLDRIVAARTTAVQEVLIADTSAYGRMLFLDGLIQSASSDEALYHETLIHPALVAHGHPRRVLIGGTCGDKSHFLSIRIHHEHAGATRVANR